EDGNFINRQSGVIRIDLGNATCKEAVLFLADSVRETFETDLCETKQWELLPAEVIVAAHHGSKKFFYCSDDGECKKGSYLEHLEKMDPKYVFISCNEDSSQENHPPHEEAIRIYCKNGRRVHRSDMDGHATVTITGDDGNFDIRFNTDPDDGKGGPGDDGNRG